MWEYKIVVESDILSEDDLDIYGMDGWELITIIKDAVVINLGPSSSIKSYSYLYHFKRLKQNDLERIKRTNRTNVY